MRELVEASTVACIEKFSKHYVATVEKAAAAVSSGFESKLEMLSAGGFGSSGLCF